MFVLSSLTFIRGMHMFVPKSSSQLSIGWERREPGGSIAGEEATRMEPKVRSSPFPTCPLQRSYFVDHVAGCVNFFPKRRKISSASCVRCLDAVVQSAALLDLSKIHHCGHRPSYSRGAMMGSRLSPECPVVGRCPCSVVTNICFGGGCSLLRWF